jgi:HEAT repeat protein
MAQSDPINRSWALVALGMLGNRAVQPVRVERVLFSYLDDPSEYVRASAITGLAYLGSERDIPVLLDVFTRDSSLHVRGRIAQSLADSAMLTLGQRMKAVPGLLRYARDRKLDPHSRERVYQALRGITHQALPDDPAAWQEWWVSEGSMQARALTAEVGNS